MDILLTIIGILGLGALLIAVWVFASAAKRYVSGESMQNEMQAMESDFSPYRHWADRGDDRRRNKDPIVFPITINGEYIAEDRRVSPDRRRAA